MRELDVAAAVPAASAPAPRRVGRAAGALLLGLGVALGVAEGVFRWRDGGAFPLVNVYEPDEARGVRLRAGASTRVRSPGGEAIEVRVNGDGFRGASWPASGPGQTLVVGDSQAFGLGVEEGETLGARLGQATGGTVIEASVPTYGPPEYLRTLEQVARRRLPATIVVVINPMNDLFEVEQTGASRYGVVDGWAVRRASMPAGYEPSPARRAVIERSHAAFALWRLWRTREVAASPSAPVPSWPELVAMERGLAAAGSVEATAQVEAGQAGGELAQAQAEAAEARRGLMEAMRRASFVWASGLSGREWRAYVDADGEPQDQIFELSYGYCAPPPPGRQSSYQTRFKGEQIKQDAEGLLRTTLKDPSLRAPAIVELRAASARSERAAARLAELRASGAPVARPPEPPPPPPTPLAGFFYDASVLARSLSARLVVVALPLALEVSPRARAREEADDEAARTLGALRARLLQEAGRRGVDVVDPGKALAALGDGGFQPDGHLSAAGHQAVAQAVAAAVSAAREP